MESLHKDHLGEFLSHDQGKILAEKRCMEMHDFRMAALMFLTGHGIKTKTHTYVEVAHFTTQCIIRTWKALGSVASCFPGPDDAPFWEIKKGSFLSQSGPEAPLSKHLVLARQKANTQSTLMPS